LKKFAVALPSLMLSLVLLFVIGCASTGGTSASTGDNSGLPEIAAYDDGTYDELPDMIAAGEM
jgi:hypothetical protein